MSQGLLKNIKTKNGKVNAPRNLKFDFLSDASGEFANTDPHLSSYLGNVALKTAEVSAVEINKRQAITHCQNCGIKLVVPDTVSSVGLCDMSGRSQRRASKAAASTQASTTSAIMCFRAASANGNHLNMSVAAAAAALRNGPKANTVYVSRVCKNCNHVNRQPFSLKETAAKLVREERQRLKAPSSLAMDEVKPCCLIGTQEAQAPSLAASASASAVAPTVNGKLATHNLFAALRGVKSKADLGTGMVMANSRDGGKGMQGEVKELRPRKRSRKAVSEDQQQEMQLRQGQGQGQGQGQFAANPSRKGRNFSVKPPKLGKRETTSEMNAARGERSKRTKVVHKGESGVDSEGTTSVENGVDNEDLPPLLVPLSIASTHTSDESKGSIFKATVKEKGGANKRDDNVSSCKSTNSHLRAFDDPDREHEIHETRYLGSKFSLQSQSLSPAPAPSKSSSSSSPSSSSSSTSPTATTIYVPTLSLDAFFSRRDAGRDARGAKRVTEQRDCEATLQGGRERREEGGGGHGAHGARRIRSRDLPRFTRVFEPEYEIGTFGEGGGGDDEREEKKEKEKGEGKREEKKKRETAKERGLCEDCEAFFHYRLVRVEEEQKGEGRMKGQEGGEEQAGGTSETVADIKMSNPKGRENQKQNKGKKCLCRFCALREGIVSPLDLPWIDPENGVVILEERFARGFFDMRCVQVPLRHMHHHPHLVRSLMREKLAGFLRDQRRARALYGV